MRQKPDGVVKAWNEKKAGTGRRRLMTRPERTRRQMTWKRFGRPGSEDGTGGESGKLVSGSGTACISAGKR